MQEKVLFLDFDGVLNSFEYCITRKPTNELLLMLDPRSVDLLNLVCRSLPDLSIVISSSWRKTHTLKEICEILNGCGFLYSNRIIGITESLYTKRGIEIDSYRTNHEISEYCIIDDDSDMLEHQLPRFIRTNDMTGITVYDALNIIKLFDPENKIIKTVMKNTKYRDLLTINTRKLP